MTLFFSLMLGIFVTMVLIPPLIRLAGPLHLLDQPDARKLHEGLIPRVGGIAIAAGVLLPVLMWVPLDRMMSGYIAGATIILVFGVWDDIRALGFAWKFLGQLAGVLAVMAGGVVLHHLPFFGLDAAPAWIAYPVTFLFLLGVINAINLFDGLDGLAGGCVMLSLAAIAVLAYQVQGYQIVLIAAAAIGSILGFLRFNTHPAAVFMGDAGSQFLGLTTAVLAIVLVENVHTALNPGVPLLLLGLPILDTLSVMGMRIKQGRSPFKADRQHLHHRLLAFGFRQYEVVSLIYFVQAILVGSALLLAYTSDAVVTGTFLTINAIVLALIGWGEAGAWRPHGALATAGEILTERRGLWSNSHDRLGRISAAYVEYAIAAFLIVGAFFGKTSSQDLSVVAFGVAAILAFAGFFLVPWTPLFTRIGVYFSSLLIVHSILLLSETYAITNWIISSYLLVLAFVLGLAIRLTPRDLFRMTPQDLLIVFSVLAIPGLSIFQAVEYPIKTLILWAIVLFYGCEYLVCRGDYRYRVLRIAAFLSLVVFGLRGWPAS